MGLSQSGSYFRRAKSPKTCRQLPGKFGPRHLSMKEVSIRNGRSPPPSSSPSSPPLLLSSVSSSLSSPPPLALSPSLPSLPAPAQDGKKLDFAGRCLTDRDLDRLPLREAAFGKGQMGSALMGLTANVIFFDRGTFWVLLLSYF